MNPRIRHVQRACEAAKARQAVTVFIDEAGQYAVGGVEVDAVVMMSAPIDIEYRERLFRVTDKVEPLDIDGEKVNVIVVRAQLLGERTMFGIDWVHFGADTDEIKACFSALADRMLAELETVN
jgi:hypothetical protein